VHHVGFITLIRNLQNLAIKDYPDQKLTKLGYQRGLEETYRCMEKEFLNTAYKSYSPPLKLCGLIEMNLTKDSWGDL
jgi:hypothetical protein